MGYNKYMQPLFSTGSLVSRAWLLKLILVCAVLLLVGRLSELTIVKGQYYRELAEQNRIRRVAIDAPRGQILARGGEVLAGNTEVKKIVKFEPTEGYTKQIAQDGDPADEIISEWVRSYPMRETGGHITGYIGEVDENEVGKTDPDCIQKGSRPLGTLIGRFGLESQYECHLRGINGEELVEVDIAGHKIRSVGRRSPIPGENVVTTIDAPLQERVAQVMKDIQGGVVATDGKGEVLALFSSPSFDPSLFVETSEQTGRQKALQQLFTDTRLPLFNRSISGGYHPGSVYKLVTSAAALEEGKITKDYLYEDTGNVRVNEFNYANWYFTQYGGKEGNINVVRALARSTDTFFYKVGEMLGPITLSEWSRKFGVGKKTNIDLPGEVAGLLATPEWKQTVKGERWYLGNTYHMSIGQGDMTTTPLQANILTSVIANGGSYCRPHLLKDTPTECEKIPMSQETIDTIIEGMIGACTTGGTAFPFFEFAPQVACKTGTAETSDDEETHAWFTIFAPVSDPDIVLTVLVEKGGEGSKVAAPIAKQIFDYWYHERPRP